MNLFNKLRGIDGKEPEEGIDGRESEEGIGEREPEGELDKEGLLVSQHEK